LDAGGFYAMLCAAFRLLVRSTTMPHRALAITLSFCFVAALTASAAVPAAAPAGLPDYQRILISVQPVTR
jgi:hypothetical protein